MNHDEIKQEIRLRWSVVLGYCAAVFAAVAVTHVIAKLGM